MENPFFTLVFPRLGEAPHKLAEVVVVNNQRLQDVLKQTVKWATAMVIRVETVQAEAVIHRAKVLRSCPAHPCQGRAYRKP
jgi:hypothetical protein